MSAVTSLPPVPANQSGLRPFRYSLPRYHEAIRAGIITENDRVELIDGELIQKMGIGKRHGDCLDLINVYFVTRYAATHVCRAQNPLSLGDHSEPEPDYALVDKASYAGRSGNPVAEDARLVVEIANATLAYDRNVKAALYARAGIEEYWIINLQDDKLELHTQPNPQTGEYDSVVRFSAGGTFTSPFCGEVDVDDLFPA